MNFRPLTPPALAALLILMTVVAYLPAIGAGYIWDDDTLLTANPQMRSVEGLEEIWRGENSRDYTPLTLSSFWVEWRLWGNTPMGYHVVNILLHSLSAVLVWLILTRLGVPGAWLGAALFAIHPVNVASVAWVAERKNTLSGAFFFGLIFFYLVAREGKRVSPYVASLALFVLAALSKGAVATLPAVLLLCVWWKDRKVTWRDFLEVVPYGMIALAAALLTIRFQARAQHYGLIPDTFDYRIARAGAAVWLYLGALIWPGGMSPMREQWVPNLRSPLTYFPALVAAGALALFFWKRRTWGRPLLFAYAYYLMMLLPVLGFVWMALMQETPSADWWQYMAAPGVFACAAAGVIMASNRWRGVMPLACVGIALLGVQTWRRASIYQSMETYCRAVTAEDPQAWTLENNLGIMLKRQRRFEEAEVCYRQALRFNPGFVEAHVNLGDTLRAAGDPAGEEAEYRLADRLRPGDPRIVYSLARLYSAEGRFNDAERCLRNALATDQNAIGFRILLCQALIHQGKKDEALQVCAEVEALTRGSGDAYAIEGAAKLRQECEGK